LLRHDLALTGLPETSPGNFGKLFGSAQRKQLGKWGKGSASAIPGRNVRYIPTQGVVERLLLNDLESAMPHHRSFTDEECVRDMPARPRYARSRLPPWLATGTGSSPLARSFFGRRTSSKGDNGSPEGPAPRGDVRGRATNCRAGLVCRQGNYRPRHAWPGGRSDNDVSDTRNLLALGQPRGRLTARCERMAHRMDRRQARESPAAGLLLVRWVAGEQAAPYIVSRAGWHASTTP
jgi:hypothetical protein